MKKFTKLFLSCAIVSALAASTAVMASAAPTSLVTDKNGLAGTYENGVLDLNLDGLDGGIDKTQQATLLVVKGTAYTDDASVVGIDQAAGADFDMTGLKGTPTAETADADGYTVMVGYYTAGASSKFQIASATLFAPEDVTDTVYVTLGDADGNGNIKAADAILTLKKANNLDARGVDVKFGANKVTPAGESEEVWLCDVDGSGEVKAADAILTLKKANNLDARGVDVKNAGKKIAVEAAEWMPEAMKVQPDVQ